MTQTHTHIQAGDYDNGGAASRQLKELLKQVGARPQDIRRAMIAAYEAEMNVVIHSRGGELRATLDEGRLDVVVLDRGPGIADVELAMKEGWSTAPSKARELGFGAGMGLPNIRRNSDHFAIHSSPAGTQVRFTILLGPDSPKVIAPNSIQVSAERCTGCLRCLRTCPTAAIRVQPGNGPRILEHLCIDCTACIAICQSHALTMDGRGRRRAEPIHELLQGASVVLPPAMLVQFGSHASPAVVLEAMRRLGVARVVPASNAEAAVRREALRWASQRPKSSCPAISPLCPAVINLIQTRFASLLPHVAPLAFPLDAALHSLADEAYDGTKVLAVAACPAQKTLLQQSPHRCKVLLPYELREALYAEVVRLAKDAPPLASPAAVPAGAPDAGETSADVMQVTGIGHVVRVLEQAENGDLQEPALLDLYACDECCFGSPLMFEEPFIARRRWQLQAPAMEQPAAALPRGGLLEARRGVRLDENMAKAIEKFAEIGRIKVLLPGLDCGLCGCPSCAALAEDVVFGRSPFTACVRLAKQQEQ